MDIQVAKWGNSLALRIPADYVRRTGIKAGDRVEASLTPDGGLTIRPATWNRKVFAEELAASRDSMKIGPFGHPGIAARGAILMVYVDTGVLVAVKQVLNMPSLSTFFLVVFDLWLFGCTQDRPIPTDNDVLAHSVPGDGHDSPAECFPPAPRIPGNDSES